MEDKGNLVTFVLQTQVGAFSIHKGHPPLPGMGGEGKFTNGILCYSDKGKYVSGF